MEDLACWCSKMVFWTIHFRKNRLWSEAWKKFDTDLQKWDNLKCFLKFHLKNFKSDKSVYFRKLHFIDYENFVDEAAHEKRPFPPIDETSR